MIRLSAGTAACLGLSGIKMDVYPTTAYLLSGYRCLMNCAFCPQGMGDNEALKRLGRISWPEYNWSALAGKLSGAASEGLQRICLQSVRHDDGIKTLHRQIEQIRSASNLPLSLSAWISGFEEAATLFALGVERISISIDVINPEAFQRIKGGLQQPRFQLLLDCAERYPGRLSTHLICGLGETEAEALVLINRLCQARITVALFAFVPLRGTPLAGASPPPLDSYRRIQAASFLLRRGAVSLEDLTFKNGRLVHFGLPESELQLLLADGNAFETSGCPGCNRPYYNERPGGVIYNYHRPLTAVERKAALEDLLLNSGVNSTVRG